MKHNANKGKEIMDVAERGNTRLSDTIVTRPFSFVNFSVR